MIDDNDEKGLPEEKDFPAASDISLDDILKKQLQALYRVTKQLARNSVGVMTKDDIQSLAVCIRVTMDLKAKENDLLDKLTDEELARLRNK